MEAFKSFKLLTRAFLAAILCLCSAPLLAQFTSSVQGTITDQSGALVNGAAVTLTDTGTGVNYDTKTNGAGVYRFVSLPPGNYVVTVTMSGFATAKVTTTVTTDEIAGVDVKLQVATAGQNVTVTTQAVGLNPEETRTELTLSASDLELIPSQNHATLNATKLAPGVTGIFENATDVPIGQNEPTQYGNGLSGAGNLYALDGVPLNSVLTDATPGSQSASSLLFTPNIDSLQEIALQTTTFSVEYGTASSMETSMTTKAGTNKFHGSADVTYADKILRAAAYNQNNKAAFHDLFDDFTLGGPIWKDRTFFFGSYEGVGTYNAGSGSYTWYTPQFINYIATADPGSQDVQRFILGNPATRIAYNGQNIQTAQALFGTPTAPIEGGGCGTPSTYSIPCGMDVVENGNTNAPSVVHGKSYNIRLDQYLRGGKDRIFFFYFNTGQTSDAIGFTPNFDGGTPTSGEDYTTNYTHTFSANLLNSATFAYTNYHFQFAPLPDGLGSLQLPYDTSILDNGSISGSTFFVPTYQQEWQYYGRDSVYWTHGRHSFEFGVEAAANINIYDEGIWARPFIYQFKTTLDFLSDRLDQETIYSHYSGLNGQFAPDSSNAVTTRFGVYAQDSWKVTPRLTVNYGIRWDDLGNPSPYTGSVAWANSIFSDNNLQNLAIGIASKPTNNFFSSARDLNFLPRGGFAWTPYKNSPSTVLRGGIGLYQDLVIQSNTAEDITSNPPVGLLGNTFNYPQTVLSYGTQSVTPPYGITFPAFTIPGYRPDGSVAPPGTVASLNGIDPNLPMSRTLVYTLAVEHELPGRAVISVSYSGSHSYDLPYQTDHNRPAGNYYCDPPALAGCTPVNHLLNTNWNSIGPMIAGMTANSNGLIAQMRQTWHSLTYNLSYTWSHALGSPLGSTGGNSGTSVELQLDPQAQYGNQTFDYTNRFSGFYLYQIPVPGSANGLVRALAGGWNLDGDVVLQSGSPFSPYYSNQDFSETGLSSGFFSIPDYAGKQHSGFTRAQFKSGIFPTTLVNSINPLFPAPNCLCIGTAGQNQFRGPGYADWDQSIVKKITLPWLFGEKSVLSLRGQAFNLLNRANLQNPSATINEGGFGLSTSANQARVIQIGSRFQF